MKWYRGPEGDQRLWFEPDEIELIMEEELRKAKLSPTTDNPATDLERLIESHLHARLDQYAELERAVLGLTRFDANKPPTILINHDLTGSALDDEDAQPGLIGRWRATLAHEAAHVILHRFLFDTDLAQDSLFPMTDVAAPASGGLMRCLKRDVGYHSSARDWREVQANRGMAALLMPQRFFKKAVRAEIAALNVADLRPGSATTSALARRIADQCNVSRQATAIRLETLGFVTAPAHSILTS